MALTSHTFRDAEGNRYRVYPEPVDGEDYTELTTDSDLWTDEEEWSDPSYTIPTVQDKTYRTLKDSAGTTWYLYAETEAPGEGTVVFDSVQPTAQAGVWNEPIYEEQTVLEGTTIDYLKLTDPENGDTYYLYPSTDGEPILSDTEPA